MGIDTASAERTESRVAATCHMERKARVLSMNSRKTAVDDSISPISCIDCIVLNPEVCQPRESRDRGYRLQLVIADVEVCER